jgi:hypothetical protein
MAIGLRQCFNTEMKIPLSHSPIHKFQYRLTLLEARIDAVLPTLVTRTDLLEFDAKLSGNLSMLDHTFSKDLNTLRTDFTQSLSGLETRMLKWFITMGVGFAALWMSSLGIVFALFEARFP